MQRRGTGTLFIGTAATAMAGVVITALLAMNYTLETALTPGAATVGVTVGTQTRPSKPSKTQSSVQQSIPPAAPPQPGTAVTAVDVTAPVPVATVAPATRPAPVSLVVRVGAPPAAASAVVSIAPVSLPSLPAVPAAPGVPLTTAPITFRPSTPATPAVRTRLAAAMPGMGEPPVPNMPVTVRAQPALATSAPAKDDGDGEHDKKDPHPSPVSTPSTSGGPTTPPVVTVLSGPATVAQPTPVPIPGTGTTGSRSIGLRAP